MLCLTITALTIGVIIYYTLAGSIEAYVITWLVGITAAGFVIEIAFRKIIQVQEQLDDVSDESLLLEKQQTALVSLSEKLAAANNEAEICQTVSQDLQATLGDEFQVDCTIYTQEERSDEGTHPVPIPVPQAEIALGTSIVAADTALDSSSKNQTAGASSFGNDHQLTEKRRSKSSISAPMQLGDQVIGELVVSSEISHNFNEDEKTMIAGVANQAALAIEIVRLMELRQQYQSDAEHRDGELRVHERYLALLNEITRAALKTQDFQAMLQTLTEYMSRLLDAESALILLWDESRQQVMPTAAFGPLRQEYLSLQIEPDDITAVSSVLNSGRTLEVSNTSTSPYINARLAIRLQIKSMLVLPLIAGNEKLGAALLFHKSEYKYSPREVSLGEQAASQLTLAITKSNALDTAQHRTQELTALQKATAALLTTLDLEILLGQILDAAISAISAAEKGTLHLVARDTGQLQIRAVQGYTDPRIRTFNPTDSASFTAVAVRERRPLIIHDANANPRTRYVGDIPEIRAISSMIIAPLLLGGRTLGAVSLDAYRRNAFTEADLQLLVTFAATATTAIQNAQLYTEVQKQAITDPLTGIYNRRGFFELGRREVERAHRFGRPLTALMIDIDLFKQVNDTQGHLTGDQVLAGVGSLIEHELRQVDLPGRYGGDEFIALLPETDLNNAFQAAERLRKSITQGVYLTDNEPVHVTASIGLAELEQPGDTLESLIERADQALYVAKQSGRNRTIQEMRG
jgi:diguanylate cyclase (GGDEF)-like protein